MAKRILAVVTLIFACAAAGLALHLAVSGGDTVFSGRRPDYLGVKDGQLARCKRSPKCVGSQTDASDTEHYIAPIAFKGSADQAIAAVRKAVEGMGRATVIRSEAGYLYAEQTFAPGKWQRRCERGCAAVHGCIPVPQRRA